MVFDQFFVSMYNYGESSSFRVHFCVKEIPRGAGVSALGSVTRSIFFCVYSAASYLQRAVRGQTWQETKQ